MAELVFTEPLITRMNVLSLGIRVYCKLLLDLCLSFSFTLHYTRGRYSPRVYCQLVESDWTIVNESIFAELFSFATFNLKTIRALLHLSEGVADVDIHLVSEKRTKLFALRFFVFFYSFRMKIARYFFSYEKFRWKYFASYKEMRSLHKNTTCE